MKINLIFLAPPFQAEGAEAHHADEQLITVKVPYQIDMQDHVRVIKHYNDETIISYEEYCVKLQEFIQEMVRTYPWNTVSPCESLTVSAFNEPPNFEALLTALSKTELAFTSKAELNFKNCNFGGALYVEAVSKFVCHFDSKVFFRIKIDDEIRKTSYFEKAKKEANSPQKMLSCLQGYQPLVSVHDKARLAMLHANVFLAPEIHPLRRPLMDDHSLGVQHDREVSLGYSSQYDDELGIYPLSYQKSRPSYFYSATKKPSPSIDSLAASVLQSFFSQEHQQRSDYTCGPATLKMVAAYYVANQAMWSKTGISPAWKRVNKKSELELAEQVKTTEEIGSDLADMRDGLMQLGLLVFDDAQGLTTDRYKQADLEAYKTCLWDKMKVILALGIPIILNMQDREGIGHYEVVIGIDKQEHIIFAEPGTALNGQVDFERISKSTFIARWKNMTGVHHGRFLILPPNAALAASVADVLVDTPHYANSQANFLAKTRDKSMQALDEEMKSPTL